MRLPRTRAWEAPVLARSGDGFAFQQGASRHGLLLLAKSARCRPASGQSACAQLVTWSGPDLIWFEPFKVKTCKNKGAGLGSARVAWARGLGGLRGRCAFRYFAGESDSIELAKLQEGLSSELVGAREFVCLTRLSPKGSLSS